MPIGVALAARDVPRAPRDRLGTSRGGGPRRWSSRPGADLPGTRPTAHEPRDTAWSRHLSCSGNGRCAAERDPQQLAAAMQPRHHCADRNIECGGDFFIGHLLHVAEQDDLLIALRKAPKCAKYILIGEVIRHRRHERERLSKTLLDRGVFD